MSSAKPATNMASEVSILKTKAAAKKGLKVSPQEAETVWPKPEFVSPARSRVEVDIDRSNLRGPIRSLTT